MFSSSHNLVRGDSSKQWLYSIRELSVLIVLEVVQTCQLQKLSPPAAPLPLGRLPTDILTIQKLTLAVLQLLIGVNSMLILDREASNCAAAWVPIFLPVLYN